MAIMNDFVTCFQTFQVPTYARSFNARKFANK